jgi:hypothetical protein
MLCLTVESVTHSITKKRNIEFAPGDSGLAHGCIECPVPQVQLQKFRFKGDWVRLLPIQRGLDPAQLGDCTRNHPQQDHVQFIYNIYVEDRTIYCTS